MTLENQKQKFHEYGDPDLDDRHRVLSSGDVKRALHVFDDYAKTYAGGKVGPGNLYVQRDIATAPGLRLTLDELHSALVARGHISDAVRVKAVIEAEKKALYE